MTYLEVFTFNPLLMERAPDLPLSYEILLVPYRSVTFPQIVIWRESDGDRERWFASDNYKKKSKGGSCGYTDKYAPASNAHDALTKWIKKYILA